MQKVELQDELDHFKQYEKEDPDYQEPSTFMEMKMLTFMDKYYLDLKQDNGISKDFGMSKKNSTLALMNGKVKPVIKEKNFEEYLSKQTKEVLSNSKANRKKSQAKKAMLQQRQIAETRQMFSQRGMRQSPAMKGRKHENIGSLFQQLAMVNKEATVGHRSPDSRGAIMSSFRSAATNYQTNNSRESISDRAVMSP